MAPAPSPPTIDDLERAFRARAAALAERDAADLGEARRLVHLERQPARPARYAEVAVPLPDAVRERMGVDRLYTHQAAALDLVRAGHSTVVATATASGKSLVHQAAIAESVLQQPSGTALCLYPTKALAHDQLRAWTRLGFPGVSAHTYDGDAGRDERIDARRNANVLLTNPEMLHYGLLPNHAGWMRFFSRLRFVVIDELHQFRGMFGSHVANVLRRLRRVAAHYGASPVFIASSATIGAPGSLASQLTGMSVTAVVDDGSPQGERVLAIWNPPVIDDEGTRLSAHGEAAGLLRDAVRRGWPTIGFCDGRKATEIVADRVRRELGPSSAARVAAYRGGLLSHERLGIEGALADGRLDAVVTTSALEVGVDIGALSVCVLDGFPGTVSAFRQRVGRVGRREQPSAAVLVCGSDQLDQWMARNPDQLAARPPEPATINPDNPLVTDAHLRCAAFELPLTHADLAYWPAALDEAVARLVTAGDVSVRDPGEGTVGAPGRRRRVVSDSPVGVWTGHGWPADAVGLRSGASGQIAIVDADGSPVGDVDRARAPEVVHPGAAYLHGGSHYRVVDLDLVSGRALVERGDDGITTTPRTQRGVSILDVERRRRLGGVGVAVGPIEVTTVVTGYERRDRLTGDRLDRVGLDLPPTVLETRGVWLTVPETYLARAGLPPDRWPGVLHAIEHAAIGVLPLFAICDRWDVGGVSTPRHADTGAPTIVIYDGYPGGAGIAELAFEVVEEHLAAVAEAVAACGCRDGCPSCVQSPKCGNGNEPLDKSGAAVVLAAIVGSAADLTGVGRRPA